MYRAKVDVTLKKSVLDPQGQTVLEALHSLGYQNVSGMRVGKHFVLSLNANDRTKAETDLKAMCDRLLIHRQLWSQ